MSRVHQLDPLKLTCIHCGVAMSEIAIIKGRVSEDCIGNAYICRVARALLATSGGRMRFSLVRYQPWEMTGEDLADEIWTFLRIHTYKDRHSDEHPQPINNLLEAMKTNPAVCPVLADAIEDAGCTDSALLSALRTP